MIFIDVGAHIGQTLEEAVQHDFEKIFAYEPAAKEYQALCSSYIDHPNITLVNAGLLDRTCELRLYGENHNMGASIFEDKIDVEDSYATALFLDVSEVFSEFEDDSVIMKLNCEGSEVKIMNRLLDTGQISKVHNVMIDFDVRKIPSQVDSEDQLLKRFKDTGFTKFVLCEDVMVGITHQKRIAAWLESI